MTALSGNRNGVNGYVHYLEHLPHHPIKKGSPTTPIWIVYDFSCHGNSKCANLNDCLMVGPPFLNDSTYVPSYCISIIIFLPFPQISKRYFYMSNCINQTGILLDFYGQKLQIIIKLDSSFEVYRFKVVSFGSFSSPFMLGAVYL